MFGRIVAVDERYLGSVLSTETTLSGYIGILAQGSAFGTTLTLTVTADAQGDSIVIAGGAAGAHAPTACTDSKGNTYYLSSRTGHPVSGPDVTTTFLNTAWIFHGEFNVAPLVIGDTITLTFTSGATDKSAVALDCGGVGAVTSYDSASAGLDFGTASTRETFNPGTAGSKSVTADASLQVGSTYGVRHKQIVLSPSGEIRDVYGSPTITEGNEIVYDENTGNAETGLSVSANPVDAGAESLGMHIGMGGAAGVVVAYAVTATPSASIFLEDATDFDDEGRLVVDPDGDADVYTYTLVDADTGEIALSPDIVRHYPEGVEVRIYPLSVERWATVVVGDNEGDEEGLLARVPHALFDRLKVGIRDLDAGEGEAVHVEYELDELLVSDLLAKRPEVDGSFITAGTAPTSDGDVPLTSPDAFVVGGSEAVQVTWAEVDNADLVYYDVYIDTAAFPASSAFNKVASVPGNSIVLAQDADGNPLVGGTLYYVAIVARDADGSAAAPGADGTATPSSASGGGGGSSTDGIAPSSSPTPVVNGGFGMLAVTWDAISNADPVGYEVHVSATTGFTPSGATLYDKVVATGAIIRTLADHSTPLAEATTYYVKLIAFDNDGSAAAGSQGSATLTQIGTADIAAAAVTTAKIATDAVTANEIAAGAVGTSELAAGAVTAAKITALTITAAEIANATITYAKLNLSAGDIPYSKLTLTGAIVNADVASGAAIAYSKLSLAASIVNADVASGAAIAYSKLNLTGAILNADLAGSIAYSKLSLTGAILNADLAGSIAYSKLTLTGSIVNADVSASAAIAYSKLALTGAILNADLAGSIAASKITGTAVTQADSGTVTSAMIANGTITATDLATTVTLASGQSIKSGTSGIDAAWVMGGSGEIRLSNIPRTAVPYSPASGHLRYDDAMRAPSLHDGLGWVPVSGHGPVGSSLSRVISLSTELTAEFGSGSDAVFDNTGGVGSGAGAAISQISNVGQHPGIVQLATGTTNAGNAYAGLQTRGVSFALLDYDYLRVGFIVRIPTLGNGTDRFAASVGLCDDFNTNSPNGWGLNTNNIAVSYADNLAGGNWQYQAGNTLAGSQNRSDTGVPVVAGNWYFIELEYVGSGSGVNVWINGVQALSGKTTNMPSTSQMRLGCTIQKTVGTSSRSMQVDAAYLYGELSAERWT